MSLVVRLSRTGKKGERKFRVVVQEKRKRRDGKPVEMLGWYERKVGTEKKMIDKKRYEYWISQGAKPSAQIYKLMEK